MVRTSVCKESQTSLMQPKIRPVANGSLARWYYSSNEPWFRIAEVKKEGQCSQATHVKQGSRWQADQIFLRKGVRNVPAPREVYSKTAKYVFLQRDSSAHKDSSQQCSRKQGEQQNTLLAVHSFLSLKSHHHEGRDWVHAPLEGVNLQRKMFNRGPTLIKRIIYTSVLFQIQKTVASCKSDLGINRKRGISLWDNHLI